MFSVTLRWAPRPALCKALLLRKFLFLACRTALACGPMQSQQCLRTEGELHMRSKEWQQGCTLTYEDLAVAGELANVGSAVHGVYAVHRDCRLVHKSAKMAALGGSHAARGPPQHVGLPIPQHAQRGSALAAGAGLAPGVSLRMAAHTTFQHADAGTPFKSVRAAPSCAKNQERSPAYARGQ